MDQPSPAYCGDEPYAFVCYSHEDSLVHGDIAWLISQGVRLWYDEGIAVGSVWRDELAEVLGRADGILFYRSVSSSQSVHCRNEISFGVDLGKPIVLVALDFQPMAPGMQLSLGGLQGIDATKLPTSARRNAILRALVSSVGREVIDVSAERGAAVDGGITIVVANADVDLGNDDETPLERGAVEQLIEVGLSKLPRIVLHERSSILSGEGFDIERLAGGRIRDWALQEDVRFVLRSHLLRGEHSATLKLTLMDVQSDTVISEFGPIDLVVTEIARGAVRAVTSLMVRAFGADDIEAVDEEVISTESLPAAAAHANGVRLQRAGRGEQAIHEFMRALSHDPEYAMSHVGLAVSHNLRGDRHKAMSHFQAAFRRIERMDIRERHRAKAIYCSLTHDNDQAIRELNALLRIFPYDPMALANLPNDYASLRQFNQAVNLSDQAQKIYPNHTMNRLNHGMFLMYNNQFKASSDVLEAMLSNGTTFAFQPYVVLALDYVALGDFEQAISVYQRIGSFGADAHLVSVIGLADLDAYRGDLEPAVTRLEANRHLVRDSNFGARFVATLIGLAARCGKTTSRHAFEDTLASADTHTLFILADSLLRASRLDEAQVIVQQLKRSISALDRLHAEMLLSRMLMLAGNGVDALDLAREQREKVNTWYGTLLIAEICQSLGAHIEALAELESCITRKGESLSLCVDELPTAHFLRDAEERYELAKLSI